MRRAVSASIIVAIVTAPLIIAPAWGKLPALSDEAKAKAAETAAKTAWADKVGAYKLCLALERTAAHYRKTAAAAGKKVVPPATATPPCTDPGAFVPPVTAAPPGAKAQK